MVPCQRFRIVTYFNVVDLEWVQCTLVTTSLPWWRQWGDQQRWQPTERHPSKWQPWDLPANEILWFFIPQFGIVYQRERFYRTLLKLLIIKTVGCKVKRNAKKNCQTIFRFFRTKTLTRNPLQSKDWYNEYFRPRGNNNEVRQFPTIVVYTVLATPISNIDPQTGNPDTAKWTQQKT